MSLDPERALSAALLNRLRADPSFADTLGSPTRVYDQPPARAVYPYLLLGRMQTQLFGGGSGEGAPAEGVAIEFTLTCVSRFNGQEEAKQVNGQVRAALVDQPLSVPGFQVVGVSSRFTDVFRAADWRSTYGVIRLRAVLEPTS